MVKDVEICRARSTVGRDEKLVRILAERSEEAVEHPVGIGIVDGPPVLEQTLNYELWIYELDPSG